MSIAIADLLSKYMSMVASYTKPKSPRIFLSHKSCLATEVAVAYSALDDDNAIVSYFFELQVITLEPKLKILSKTLF